MTRPHMKGISIWQFGTILAVAFVILPLFSQLVSTLPRALVDAWWNTSYGPNGDVTRRTHRVPKTLDDLL